MLFIIGDGNSLWCTTSQDAAKLLLLLLDVVSKRFGLSLVRLETRDLRGMGEGVSAVSVCVCTCVCACVSVWVCVCACERETLFVCVYLPNCKSNGQLTNCGIFGPESRGRRSN